MADGESDECEDEEGEWEKFCPGGEIVGEGVKEGDDVEEDDDEESEDEHHAFGGGLDDGAEPAAEGRGGGFVGDDFFEFGFLEGHATDVGEFVCDDFVAVVEAEVCGVVAKGFA